MGLDGEGLGRDKLRVGGRGAEGQAHGAHRQGQGSQAGDDEIGQLKDFNEQEQANKLCGHEGGIDPAGELQPQTGNQVVLGGGEVGLQVGEFVDPDDGGDEEGQGQANGGA